METISKGMKYTKTFVFASCWSQFIFIYLVIFIRQDFFVFFLNEFLRLVHGCQHKLGNQSVLYNSFEMFLKSPIMLWNMAQACWQQ